jgi:linoleoyl-CoA desaturase
MIKDKINFPVQTKPDFINELRYKVKEYFETGHISKFGNANIVLKSVFMVSLYLMPYILILSGVVQLLPLIFLCWVIMGIGMAGVGMVLMHDANHGSYSKNRKLNALLAKSLFLLGGFPPNWQYQHNTLHHGFTNIEGHDEDIAPMGLLRFSPHKLLRKVHKYQYLYAWFFYGLMTISWTTIKDFQKLYEYKMMDAELASNKSYNQLLIQLIVSKILYYILFLVIPLIILPISWYWIVLFYFAMHFISGLILSMIFQTAHVVTTSEYPLPDENGNLENNWAIHQLLTTSDFAPKSKIFSWLIGGLNFQVEHHLFPNISHVHYKNIAHLVKETALKHGLPYYVQPTFILALSNHTQMLKMLGKEKYPHVPSEEHILVYAAN